MSSFLTLEIEGAAIEIAARNISKNALYLTERRRGLYKNYLSDRSYENKGAKSVFWYFGGIKKAFLVHQIHLFAK